MVPIKNRYTLKHAMEVKTRVFTSIIVTYALALDEYLKRLGRFDLVAVVSNLYSKKLLTIDTLGAEVSCSTFFASHGQCTNCRAGVQTHTSRQ